LSSHNTNSVRFKKLAGSDINCEWLQLIAKGQTRFDGFYDKTLSVYAVAAPSLYRGAESTTL